ncbi:unnamed protein product [Linum tenue]|uniref:Uncharacterized protein n=1 Tax=Linum tenue TaxID=586396 RepID=A0AAV0PYW3_9ROSI|nr:unnamed protein product [Linum tenue]
MLENKTKTISSKEKPGNRRQQAINQLENQPTRRLLRNSRMKLMLSCAE